MSIFPSPFRPARLILHPHLQTIFPRYHRRRPLEIERRRESLVLPDGDELLLDWHGPTNEITGSPITVIVHGLSGTSSSHYVVGLQLSLAKRGWASVAMNCRGATQPNRLVRAYHAGAGDDVQAVLKHVIDSTNRPVNLVGYSLGGCMSLHALSTWGNAKLLKAVVVSVPLDFPKCANRMARGFSKLYSRVLIRELVEQFQAKANHLRTLGDESGARLIDERLATGPFADFWQFDDRIVAPLHGFADVHDYYAKCSPTPLLAQIAVPTLVIHSSDDPFMSPDVVPRPGQLSPAISFELSRHGGHVGFIGGSVRNPDYYLERRIPEFLMSDPA